MPAPRAMPDAGTADPVAPALAAGGEIAVLVLADGRECRATARGSSLAARGRRVLFDCGISGGDRLGIVGLLAADAGLLTAQQALVEWQASEVPEEVGPVAARAARITLSDGLDCRDAGRGATLAFEGRRASYTCGMKDGDTVALLGELEPVEGGFRIVRARLAHDEGGFRLRSSEPILVTSPR